MRTFLFFILLMLLPGLASAAGIVAAQSFAIPPYDEAVAGFASTVGAPIRKRIVTEQEENVAEAVRREKPDLLLAVGSDALAKVRHLGLPVVYLMVFTPPSPEDSRITGISMNIPPERQLAGLLTVLPQVKRIGILYSQRSAGMFLRKAQQAARSAGVELVAREIRHPREVPQAVDEMKSRIDALWCIPDTTVMTPETTQHLLLFSLQNGIPLHTVSERLVGMGALSAVSLDPAAMGRQGGEMARRILTGTSPADIPRSDPSVTRLVVNLKVAQKLNVSVSADALAGARVIR